MGKNWKRFVLQGKFIIRHGSARWVQAEVFGSEGEKKIQVLFLFLSITIVGGELKSLTTLREGGHVNYHLSKLDFMEIYRFIVFKIEEKIQQVTVEKLGGPDETYADFSSSMPANECRYAVYDYDFTTNENCQKSKIYFIAWYAS